MTARKRARLRVSPPWLGTGGSSAPRKQRQATWLGPELGLGFRVRVRVGVRAGVRVDVRVRVRVRVKGER